MMLVRQLFVIASVTLTLGITNPASAGDVAASVGGGTLKIKGSADADVLTISTPVAGQVTVTPGIGTTVNGSAALQVFPDVSSLKVELGDGADDLTIDGVVLEKLTIATGKGSDDVRVFRSRFHDKAKIDLGADNNTLALCSNDFTALAIKCGPPIDQVVTVECSFPDSFSSTSNFGSAIAIGDIEVTGTLSIKGGKGFETVVVQHSTLGPTKMKLGTANSLAFCDTNIGSDLAIDLGGGADDLGGTAECPPEMTGPFAEGTSALVVSNVSVDGQLKVKAGKGGDGITLDGVTTDGTAKLDLGAGLNFLGLFDTFFQQDVSAKSGKHSDDYVIEDSMFDGNLTIKLGAGSNTLIGDADSMAQSSSVDGNLTVKAGKGNDVIDTTDIAVGGTRSVNGGGGTDVIN